MADDLPKFENPPVVETVMGIQFLPLARVTNAHFGAFWQELGTRDWPQLQDQAPLDPTFEEFDSERVWVPPVQRLTLTSRPVSRVQMRSLDGDAMVQVQNGRLLYNWIGREQRGYPSFDTLQPKFRDVVGRFEAFVETHSLGELSVNQWEITYVNHIPRGTVWNEPADWSALFAGLPGLWQVPSCGDLESVNGNWHFVIAPARGRLHAELSVVYANGSEEPAVRFVLTARGPAETLQDAYEGIVLGRHSIVTSFAELTSTQAHRYWGRTA